MNIKLSSEIWHILTGIRILDADGWDRTPGKFQESWNEPITFKEFINRCTYSTTRGWSEEQAKINVSKNIIKFL